MHLGNGPIATSPVYCTDEEIFIRCTGDYAVITPPSQELASGIDGYFSIGDPWRLNSTSNDFQSQGVAAQNIVWIKGPARNFPGGGIFMAVDSAAGNSIVLRRPGQTFNFGMPPGPAAGLTGVSFLILTLYPQSEEASYHLKQVRFMIDERVAYRASSWIYQGAEDPYRILRRMCVARVLADRYMAEVREERGDFEMKMCKYAKEFQDQVGLVQVRWGPLGNSAEPTDIFSGKISR